MKLVLGMLTAAGLLAGSMAPASALPAKLPLGADASVQLVAQGCGPGGWRGPWGGCRDTPYTGPLPGGGFAAPYGRPAYYGNGCPPGYWRGPWGHCRDTPYHGPLPGGGFQ